MTTHKVFRIFALLGAIWLTGFAVIPVRAASKPVTDDAIYDHVREKLAVDQVVKGGALEVEVHDGAVVLKGKVDSERRKDKAEKIARKVAGVKSVVNQIQVVNP
jgi:osmotically-inducible protein OsmY